MDRYKFLKSIEVAAPMEWQKMNGHYSCPELTMPCTRLGGDDAASLPSRVGNTLHYRDGRVERIEP